MAVAYWHVTRIQERMQTKEFRNARQLSIASGVAYAVVWRILDEPDERIERLNLDVLFKLHAALALTRRELPWVLLRYEP